ncbi:hypothetical protein ACFS07_33145 [Undibacterium arcticum]
MNYAEIESRLTALALPVPNPSGLAAIRSVEGEKFDRNLREAERQDQVATGYLASVIKATAPFCAEVLTQHGFDAELANLIRVSAEEGTTLFRALNALKKGGDVASVAETYLVNHFEKEEVSHRRRRSGSTP